MTNRVFTGLITLAASLLFASGASAISFTGDSLYGSIGELTITDNGANSIVTWSLDTTGFHDQLAIDTGHILLTDVAFKISGMTDVALHDDSADVGTLHFPYNISSASGGCTAKGFRADFACVTLDPAILATTDQVFSVYFLVEGDLNLDEEVSFRGKYGNDDGWVISENSGSAVPEPSSALVFGLGALVVGMRSTRG